MESFVIEGGQPLRGEVTPSGNKNAALPLLAACLLTDEPVILHNVPDIGDVRTMRALIGSLGVEIQTLDDHTLRLHAQQVRRPRSRPAPPMRLILLAGRCSAEPARPSCLPGGDVIGRRRSTPSPGAQAYGVERITARHASPASTGGTPRGAVLLDEPASRPRERHPAAVARGKPPSQRPPNPTSKTCVTC
jgi:UDP-N-acetylglucosamine 1-carboxyvinyltransferase